MRSPRPRRQSEKPAYSRGKRAQNGSLNAGRGCLGPGLPLPPVRPIKVRANSLHLGQQVADGNRLLIPKTDDPGPPVEMPEVSEPRKINVLRRADVPNRDVP